MQAAAKSVFYFGIYLVVVGLQLLFIPQIFFNVFRLGNVHDVWIRVVGVLVLGIAYYYIQTARLNMNEFFPLTVFVRVGVFVSFTGLVLLKLGPGPLALFGLIDLGGACWTWMSLKKEKSGR